MHLGCSNKLVSTQYQAFIPQPKQIDYLRFLFWPGQIDCLLDLEFQKLPV